MPVMLPTVLHNLFGGPATRMYPVKVREPFAGARGHIEFNDDNCILCGSCARNCPAAAIEIDKEKNQLVFNPARCIICAVCTEVCKKDAVVLVDKWRTAYYSKPMEVHTAKAKKEKDSKKE